VVIGDENLTFGFLLLDLALIKVKLALTKVFIAKLIVLIVF
jgi:hypothetical protein